MEYAFGIDREDVEIHTDESLKDLIQYSSLAAVNSAIESPPGGGSSFLLHLNKEGNFYKKIFKFNYNK